jgi:hypothetical protein
MNVTIRMIGMATTFFWIFLIAFSASAMYSVKDVYFDFEKPQISITADSELLLSLPINIVNNGYYDIGPFHITTEVSDVDGNLITRGSTLIPIIRKGIGVNGFHNITLDINDLLTNRSYYLFDDTGLRIAEFVNLKIAEIIPIQASTNFSIPWGAPLYNFTLGKPETETFDLTHFKVIIPISFENHAFYDIFGNIQISMYNSAELFVGQGQTEIEVPQYSPYNGLVEFYVSMTEFTSSGHFEVFFQTQLFNYGPLVIPYG